MNLLISGQDCICLFLEGEQAKLGVGEVTGKEAQGLMTLLKVPFGNVR